MKTDIEIARENKLIPITEIASKININVDEIEQYGKYIAKVPVSSIKNTENKHLILVTALTPTKAGIGKTTVSVGLALGLNKIGKNAVLALREPSLGPCFGMKGGACGGGYAQVLPMDKINLHFTGDFHAITAAHNMIAALLDNYIYQHQKDGFGMKEILWKRVLDINDRNLRKIITGIGPNTNGVMMESGFDITPASEIMAILCLTSDMDDLYRRIDKILLGTTLENKPFYVKDLNATGSICVLLKDAINPNLVQTTENTPAFIHGGPFANIAHGCNSVIATKMALSYGDYVITEAGFGADLGAEKFFDIKCRKSGLTPELTVLVVTLRGIKLHGGANADNLSEPNQDAIRIGMANVLKHIKNLRKFNQKVVVCINRYGNDIDEELNLCKMLVNSCAIPCGINNAFEEGGNGCQNFAKLIVETIENSGKSKQLKFIYQDSDSIKEKANKVATEIYGATGVEFSPAAEKMIKVIKDMGIENYPICIAKTQYSFTDNPKILNIPTIPFKLSIRDIIINNGAEMIVLVAGDIMRMPGLPKVPQAEKITIINGEIDGLS